MMNVVLVRDISVSVVHVLAGVDVEVLLLLISDVEQVLLHLSLVLSEVSTDYRLVPLSSV